MDKNTFEEVFDKNNNVTSLRRHHICHYQDYTVCEYSLDDGELKTHEGGLLELCGMHLPASLENFEIVARGWPIESEHLEHMLRHIRWSMDPENPAKAFSDVDIMVESGELKCWMSLASVRVTTGGRNYLLLFFVSVNDKKYQLLQLIGKAQTDSLTGAANRRTLQSTVENLASDGEVHAIIMMDIDGFKKFNDTFGHTVGDDMLINIVRKLTSGLRKDDVVGRIGGDEFMIILRDASDPAAIEKLASQICVLTRHSMSNGMYVSASLGIAFAPKDGTSFEELYRKADRAMYRAKRRGGDQYVIYNPAIESAAEEADLAAANITQNSVVDASILVRCRVSNKSFIYPELAGELFSACFDDRPIWQVFSEDGVASAEVCGKINATIEALSGADALSVHFDEYFLRSADGIWRWYRVGYLKEADNEHISMIFTDINEEIVSNRRLRHIAQHDELTGLFSSRAFDNIVEGTLRSDPEGVREGRYAYIYLDIHRFKAINDMFGSEQGDQLLLYIAELLQRGTDNGGAAARLGSDRFVMLVRKNGDDLENFINGYIDALANYELAFEIVSNLGIYVIQDAEMTPGAMLDRAILAQSSIKGSYIQKYCYYTEELRKDMLSEQEIMGMMGTAITEKQFMVYYQPQYDHSNGSLVGAEALVRWKHPERGMIMPGTFIPIFEKNGFISRVDLYVFEQVCEFLRYCIDNGVPTVPVSVNIARYDIFQQNFIEMLESVRTRHDVPVELVRIEITESSLVGSNKHVAEVINKLHRYGYTIEMDDFGCGYSSLNVLKDIDLDILKLDMQFLSEDVGNNRGGTILSSVVRMARWLGLPVIAEGIETAHQADYLRSIGCNYVQGYFYARPMPQQDYEGLLTGSETGVTVRPLNLIDTLDAGDFWNPESQETLIFSNYVGGAAIFSYYRPTGSIELMRVNKKYLQELGGELNERELLGSDPLKVFDDKDRRTYVDMLERAISSAEEEECETWRRYFGCGCERICIRSSVRMIGRGGDNYLFYEMVRNITSEKEAVAEIMHRENIFRAASEQVNIYYWEYIIATKEMIPCFRCMRDLGFPQVMYNYPEPAIEMGVFPPEVADNYRDIMKSIDNGVASIEADIPLTLDRIPFRIRYTTEFDENGKPVKAYGSASPIQ